MRQGGFTLLEMIVVLALLGLVTAMVVPSMLRGIDSWRRQSAMDALLDQIRALPGVARASGKALLIDDKTLASNTPPLRIEEGWRLSAPVPLQVAGSGVCSGGELAVGNAYGQRRIKIAAPFCDPQVQP
ncbi:MAG: type II secretion system protein [Xanthomonadaceae bacterium]|nr:type II secretion system protein [Xanthomonadaceae bacterium]